MKTMSSFMCVVVILALAAPALAQQPQAKSRAEYDAYMAVYSENKDYKKRAELGEKFLTDYKDSDFRAQAFNIIADAYSRTQNNAKVMEMADKLMTDFPNATPQMKGSIYGKAMLAAEAAGNIDKMVDYGEKTLVIDPGNLEILVTLGKQLSEQQITDEAKKTATLNKAFDFANRAKDGAAKVFGGAKPANLSDAQWKDAQNSFESNIYSTLGMIHLNRNEFEKSINAYTEALKRAPKDDVAYFRMGLAHNGLNRDYVKELEAAVKAENDAKTQKADQVLLDELVAKREAIQNNVKANQDKTLETLAKAVALAGPAAAPARQQLERLYKAKNNDSLQGLDELIQKAKASMSN